MTLRSISESILDTLDRNTSWLFPLPAFIVAGGLFVYPLVRLVWLSFNRWMLTIQRPSAFVGFANYIQAFTQDPHFWKSIWLTCYFAFASLAGQFILGFALALLLNRKFKGESVFRTLMLLPLIATPVAMSLVWSMLMNPMMGHLNYYLSLVGLGPSLWVADRATVMPSIIMVEIWHWTPLVMLILLAGLKSLPKDPFEAAIIDGASRIQIFFKVTLPLMRSYIFLVFILRLVHSIKTFDKIYVLSSGGGPNRAAETLNLMIYQEAFQSLNYGYASALGTVMLIIIFVISFALFRYRQKSWSY